MTRAILLATTLALGCTSKPQPKLCSAEAPPAHEKGPVSIGMCTSDGPPPSSSADAGTDASEVGEPPAIDAAGAASTKSATAD